MLNIIEKILSAKQENKSLFYNSAGSKKAYQNGVKHISSAEFLGFADKLPNGNLRIKKDFYLVDFDMSEIKHIQKASVITPQKLEDC